MVLPSRSEGEVEALEGQLGREKETGPNMFTPSPSGSLNEPGMAKLMSDERCASACGAAADATRAARASVVASVIGHERREPAKTGEGGLAIPCARLVSLCSARDSLCACASPGRNR